MRYFCVTGFPYSLQSYACDRNETRRVCAVFEVKRRNRFQCSFPGIFCWGKLCCFFYGCPAKLCVWSEWNAPGLHRFWGKAQELFSGFISRIFFAEWYFAVFFAGVLQSYACNRYEIRQVCAVFEVKRRNRFQGLFPGIFCWVILCCFFTGVLQSYACNRYEIRQVCAVFEVKRRNRFQCSFPGIFCWGKLCCLFCGCFAKFMRVIFYIRKPDGWVFKQPVLYFRRSALFR